MNFVEKTNYGSAFTGIVTTNCVSKFGPFFREEKKATTSFEMVWKLYKLADVYNRFSILRKKRKHKDTFTMYEKRKVNV